MSNPGWPAPSEPQYGYPQHPAPDAYGRYPANQQTYSSYDLPSQTPYPSTAYTNSPYESQYQHARPSDVFGPTSYNVEPSQQGTAGYRGNQGSFFTPQHLEAPTISPESLQYSAPPSQTMNRTMAASALQQSNGLSNHYNPRALDSSTAYFSPSQNGNFQQTQTSAVQYPTLKQDPDMDSKQNINKQYDAALIAQPRAQPVREPAPNPLRITHPQMHDDKAANKPLFSHATYLRWENEPVPVPAGLKSRCSLYTVRAVVLIMWFIASIPRYTARKSKSGRELVPGFDTSRKFIVPRSYRTVLAEFIAKFG